MNDVLHYLRTQKNGDSFVDCIASFRKIYRSKGYSYLRNCEEQIYSHAFKFRHFIFIEYFMQNFRYGWDLGLESLCKSSIKHIDFLYLFKKFKSIYYNTEEDIKTFNEVFTCLSALILKKNTWSWFDKFVHVWFNKDECSSCFFHLIGSSITYRVSTNKYMQLLNTCFETEEINFKSFASIVFCRKLFLDKEFNSTAKSYAEMLIMYGAAESSKRYYPKPKQLLDYYFYLCQQVSKLLLLYCFERRSVELIF